MYFPIYQFCGFKAVRQPRVCFLCGVEVALWFLLNQFTLWFLQRRACLLMPVFCFICLRYKYAVLLPAQCTQVYRSNPHNNPNTFRLVRQALSYFSALVILLFHFPNHYDCQADKSEREKIYSLLRAVPKLILLQSSP